MRQIDSYLICTTPRSGSTLLCSMLAATGVAGQPDSFFRAPSRAWWTKEFGLPPAPDPLEPNWCRDFLTAALMEGRGSQGLFGARIMQESLVDLVNLISMVYPEPASDVQRLARVFGKTRYVHLSRIDKVAQAVSRVRAEQTGLWHRNSDGSELERLKPPSVPFFDFAHIHREVVQAEAHDAAWGHWFRANGITPFRLTYEDLAAAPQDQLGALLQELGVPSEAARGVEPPVAKLADALNLEWAEAYRAQAAK